MASIINQAKGKPGDPKQATGTPREVLDAIQNRFGKIVFDLAANSENHVCPFYYDIGNDSLDPQTEWPETKPMEYLWLNPEFCNIAPWAARCCAEKKLGKQIMLLVPASVDTKWYRNFVENRAMVYWLSPRLKFVGHTQSFPKPMMLAIYSRHVPVWTYGQWQWKPEKPRAKNSLESPFF